MFMAIEMPETHTAPYLLVDMACNHQYHSRAHNHSADYRHPL